MPLRDTAEKCLVKAENYNGSATCQFCEPSAGQHKATVKATNEKGSVVYICTNCLAMRPKCEEYIDETSKE